MAAYPRLQLNRGMVMLRYKQPFLDWIKASNSEPLELTLEEANDDGEVFLVPEYDSEKNPVGCTEDAVKWVEKRWRMLFEHALNGWVQDETLWPGNLTLKMFREWFEVEYRSMVWDMGHEPLMVEDFDDGMDDEMPDAGNVLH